MRFGPKVVKYRHIILLVAVLLLIPSIIGYKSTRINYDMLSYLPKNIQTVKGQDELLKDFHTGGFTIIAVDKMNEGQVTQLKNKIAKVNHVSDVINAEDVINPNMPKSMYPKILRDNMGKKDTSLMVVFFDTSTSAEPTLQAIEKIRSICNDNCYVSGMSAFVSDLKNLCEQEEAKYVILAVVLSLLAMMILLDSYAAPFLFLISIGMAIMYNLGSNIFLGEISYITKAIAAVLQLGVTMDYSIFLWHSFVENRDNGKEPLEAMGDAINDTLVSVTGSSITTVAGFLALCFMSYTMGKDLGIVMAKGVIFGVLSSVTILPALLLAFQKLLNKTRHKTLIKDMSKVAHALTSRYPVYIALFVILIIPAVIGYNRDNISYDFTTMLTSGSNLSADQIRSQTANDKIQKEFGIGTTHMILASSKLSDRDGRAMSNEISQVKGVQNVLGKNVAQGVDIPTIALPNKLNKSLVAGGRQLILVNSNYKVSTSECNHQIDTIKQIVGKYDKTATVIGEGPATQDLIKITAKDFQVVNIISIVAVFFIIFFVLKSWSLPFILIAIIEFAIYVNLGIPGYTGTSMPFIVPVCISTIQLGSTVDYAILMSTRYKVERGSGKEKRESIEIAARTSIQSIIVSATSFFAATIGVSIYSNIGIIKQLCTLMARGALISMIVVILVLPSMLMAFDGIICKTTKGLRKKDLIEAASHEEA